MDSTAPLTLQLTSSSIESYCRDLARRAPTLEKRVAALDALITFITVQSDPGEQAKQQFSLIRQILLDHFEEARAALLDERAQRLQQALAAQQLHAITALYTALSRDAFWTLLARVEQRLDTEAATTLRSWAAEWISSAMRRAQQASPYPDAIDFTAAGIDATAFLAMSDLGRYLGINTSL